MPDSTEDARATAVRNELDAALAEVTAAEEALDAVLGKLRAGVRAEKVSVTAAVEAAFARLRSSRETLASLRKLVDKL